MEVEARYHPNAEPPALASTAARATSDGGAALFRGWRPGGSDLADRLTRTPMIEPRLRDERVRRFNMEMTPHRRIDTGKDIASTVAFLCSPAGSLVDGRTIVVDVSSDFHRASVRHCARAGMHCSLTSRGRFEGQ